MSVRFILGPAGSGKTYHCITSLAEELQRRPFGAPLFYILPEQATFIHERRLAEACAGGGFSRAQVSSFSRLSYLAYGEAGEDPRPTLGNSGKLLLAGNVLAQHRQELQVLGKTAAQKGFGAYLAKLADELQIYQIGPAFFAQGVEKLAAQEIPGSKRLADIALLYQAYAEALAERAGSFGENMAHLAEQVEAGWLKDAEIYIDGYCDFIPAERQVVMAMLSHCLRVEITLPLDPAALERPVPADDPFYPAWREYSRLMEWIRQAKLPVEEPLLLTGEQGRFAQNKELALLERSVAGQKVLPQQGKPQSIRLWTAAGRLAELEQAGREIQRLVREEGLHYRDISIILRDPAPYADLLPVVFTSMNIPFFQDSRKPLLSHCLVDMVRALLEIWAEKPYHRHVFRYLKNPLSPIYGQEADRLENYALAHGFRFWQWQGGPWQVKLLPNETPELAQEMEEIRQKGMGAVMDFCAALGEGASAETFCTLLKELLQQTHVPERLDALLQQALDRGDGEQAEWHRQAWDRLDAMLNEAILLLGEKVYPSRELMALLESAFAGLTISTIPPGRDQVFLSALERSRTPELKAVFLLGLNEGILPKRAEQDGLLRDYDRQMLAKQGVHTAADTLTLQFQENYLCYVALSRTGGKLYLSYLTVDEEGKSMSPSPLLRRVKGLFPGLAQENPVITYALLTGGSGELAKAGVELRKGSKDPIWQAVINHERELPERETLFRELTTGLTYQPRTRPLSPRLMEELYHGKLYGSVSRLERFRLCPFSYFAGYGLKLKPRPEYTIRPADRGDLYHHVLKAVGEKVAQNPASWQQMDRPQAEALVDWALDQELETFLAGILTSSARYAYLRSRMRETLVGAVLVMAEHVRHSHFVPVAFELSFGGETGKSLPAFHIPLGNDRELILSGQIDRVDMAQSDKGSYFRIVDYKTGQPKCKPEEIMAGLKVQLLLYLEVVLANADFFHAASPHAAGMYYAYVRDDLLLEEGTEPEAPGLKLQGLTVADQDGVELADPGLAGNSQFITAALKKDGSFRAVPYAPTEEELAQLRQSLEASLCQGANALLDGEISVSPLRDQNHDACAYCDFAAVCGFDRELAPARNLAALSGEEKEEEDGDTL